MNIEETSYIYCGRLVRRTPTALQWTYRVRMMRTKLTYGKITIGAASGGTVYVTVLCNYHSLPTQYVASHNHLNCYSRQNWCHSLTAPLKFFARVTTAQTLTHARQQGSRELSRIMRRAHIILEALTVPVADSDGDTAIGETGILSVPPRSEPLRRPRS